MTPLVGLVEWRLPVTGPRAVRFAAAVGAEGVQLEFGGPHRGVWADDPDRIDALRVAADRTGVALLALAGNCLNNLPIDSPAAHRIGERLIATAARLGVPAVLAPAFRRAAIDSPAAFDRTARFLRSMALAAAERGLLLGCENTLSVEAATALAAAVDAPALRWQLDCYNPVEVGLDVARLASGLAPLLADQVHLKDGPPAVGTTPPLGSGRAALPATLAALRARRVPVRALVLEGDYRDGARDRLLVDLAWARRAAGELDSTVVC